MSSSDEEKEPTQQQYETLTQHELMMLCTVCTSYMLLQPSTDILGTMRQHDDMENIGVFLMVYFISYIFGCILHARLISINNIFSYYIIFASLSVFSAFILIFICDSFILFPILITIINAVSSSALFPSLMHFISCYYSDNKLYIIFCVFALFKIITDILFNIGINTTNNYKLSVYSSCCVGFIGILIFIFALNQSKTDQIRKETEPFHVLSLQCIEYLFSETPFVSIIASASFLVILYTLNAFTTLILSDVHGSDASTLSISDIMLPFGMLLTVVITLYTQTFRKTIVYEIGLMIAILILVILTLITWFCELNVIDCTQNVSCLVVYNISFVLYGCGISYPLLITNFVALIKIIKFEIGVGIAASFLNGFMALTSGVLSIVSISYSQNEETPLYGWKWVTLILIPFSVATLYLYRKLVINQSVWGRTTYSEMRRLLQ